MQLDVLDWIVIAAYIGITLFVGFALRTRASQDLSQFLISGRGLSWWIAGTSMVATTFAADTPLVVTALVIKNGVAGNWMWWSFALGGMITALVYAPLWRRAEVMTDVELIEMRYGGLPAAALRIARALFIGLLVNSLVIGWVSKAMMVFVREFFFDRGGFDQMLPSSLEWWIIVGLTLMVGLYSTISGMWGVAVNDVIQFFVAMAGCIILAIVAVGHVGGIETLKERVVTQFADGEQALWIVPRFSGASVWLPLHAFLIMSLVYWWATWYPGAEPGGGGYVVQRMASCKNERHALAATVWFQTAHYCLRPWPWIVVALVALVMYPQLRSNYLKDPTFNPEVGFPMVIRAVSPSGLRGLMVVVFLAAYMSTISTQINWGASYLVRDIYQRFLSKDASQRKLVMASRWASAIVLAAGLFTTWRLTASPSQYSIDKIWGLLLALGSGTGAVFMLRWFWWRINAWTEIAAMAGSLAMFWIIGVQGVPSEWKSPILAPDDQTRLLWSAMATIMIWLLVTFLTPPEKDHVLVAFYRKVLPGGVGWGHIPDLAGVRSTDLIFRPLLAALSASLFIFGVLSLAGDVIFHEWRQAAISGGCVSGFGLATLWLMRGYLATAGRGEERRNGNPASPNGNQALPRAKS